MRDIEVEVGAAVTARRTIRWRRIERLISARACDNDLLVGYLKRQRDAPPLHQSAHERALPVDEPMLLVDARALRRRQQRHEEAPLERTRTPRTCGKRPA